MLHTRVINCTVARLQPYAIPA